MKTERRKGVEHGYGNGLDSLLCEHTIRSSIEESMAGGRAACILDPEYRFSFKLWLAKRRARRETKTKDVRNEGNMRAVAWEAETRFSIAKRICYDRHYNCSLSTNLDPSLPT